METEAMHPTDVAERLSRLEDALVDLATIMAGGAIALPSILAGPDVSEANQRFVVFIAAVRNERSS
jgi:hypothetical protein